MIAHEIAAEGMDEDTYTFTLSKRKIKEIANYLYNPPLLGGERLDPVIADYADGADFYFSLSDPRIYVTPLDETNSMFQVDPWTRLDFASLFRLDAWRRESKARQEAQLRADHHLS